MPTIYRIQCSACGKGPKADNGLAGWVTSDGCQGGEVFPEGYLAVRLDDGALKPLPHPIESSTLQGLGLTWVEATRQNRLFRVTFKICQKCGRFHTERQHHDPRTGCLIALTVAPIMVAALKYVAKLSWGSSLFGAYPGMVAIVGMIWLINWLRWRKQNSELKLSGCSNCGCANLATISKMAGKVLMCPHCQTQNMHCVVAGKA